MNKDAIYKTALLSKEEEIWVLSSPLCDGLIGVGKTREECIQNFKSLVQERYVAYLEGRLAGSSAERKKGRPKKNCVEFHTQLKPEIKSDIVDMAKDFGLSQGDIIEFLFRCYKKNQENSESPLLV